MTEHPPARRANYRHGGNMPPFRAVLRCGDGSLIDLIPALAFYREGQPQRWMLWIPEDARLVTPCTLEMISVDESRLGRIEVILAVQREGCDVTVYPPQAVAQSVN